MRRFSLIQAVIPVLLLTACQTSAPEVTELERSLLGSNEVPPIETSASGEVNATLRGNVLTVEGSFSGLEGELREVQGTPAHIHQAPVGATGGIVFPLQVEAGEDNRSGTFSLSETLTEEQREAFEAGLYYVNVHSTVHPSGELRAQLHDEDPVAPGDLAAVAAGVTELTAVSSLLQASGLLEELEPTEGEFTVLAPNNEAIAAAAASLPSSEEVLTQILLHHVIPARLTFDALASMDEVTTMSGETISIQMDAEGNLVLDGEATITKRNILAANGLIHVIDGALMPYDMITEVALSGEEETPAVETDATGTATVALRGNTLYVFGSFQGMTATAAHIHGPAAPGEPAGVLHGLVVDNDSMTFAGEAQLDSTELGYLAAGRLYLNVHSEAFPGGEIRGQIVPPAE